MYGSSVLLRDRTDSFACILLVSASSCNFHRCYVIAEFILLNVNLLFKPIDTISSPHGSRVDAQRHRPDGSDASCIGVGYAVLQIRCIRRPRWNMVITENVVLRAAQPLIRDLTIVSRNCDFHILPVRRSNNIQRAGNWPTGISIDTIANWGPQCCVHSVYLVFHGENSFSAQSPSSESRVEARTGFPFFPFRALMRSINVFME